MDGFLLGFLKPKNQGPKRFEKIGGWHEVGEGGEKSLKRFGGVVLF